MPKRYKVIIRGSIHDAVRYANLHGAIYQHDRLHKFGWCFGTIMTSDQSGLHRWFAMSSLMSGSLLWYKEVEDGG